MAEERDARLPVEIDTSVAHSPRIWNYWLGGKDYYDVDREVGDELQEMNPQIVAIARADRAFLGRTVRFLAGEAGVRQFLDIGTGLPTADNTHEVAQWLAPESRIVYVDNDPLVLAHARALLTSTAEGATAYLDADLHDPDTILEQAARTLDFSRPVGVMLLGVALFILDDDQAQAIMRRLMDAMPSGSYLVLTHLTAEVDPEGVAAHVAHWNQFGKPPLIDRTPEQITRLFDGLELLDPGVVSCPLWRPDPNDIGTPTPVDVYGGVGRKR